MLICLDPGHGGRDRANRGPTGYVEADGVLDIALRTRSLLQAQGLQVIMTRERDETVALAARTALANSRGADLLVSIHTDAASSPAARGCTVFCSANRQASRQLAVAIEAPLRAAGRPSRGVRTRTLSDGRDYYHVIREAKMPAVIVECAFHTNPEEEALLQQPQFRQLLATAIAAGITDYAGVSHNIVAIELENRILDVPGRLLDGVTYAPVRALAEALGLRVYWDAERRLVRLSHISKG